MQVTALILAAGSGTRLRSKISKPLMQLNGSALLLYSLRVFERHPAVHEIIVVVNQHNQRLIERLVRTVRGKKVTSCVRGGVRRQDSVRRGLAALSERCDTVLVHDAARPLIDAAIVTRVLAGVRRCQAALCAVPVKSTVKRVAGRKAMLVKETLPRDSLVEVQTPQGFSRKLLEAAYKRYGRRSVTDDAALIERMGKPVAVVAGSYRNIKITTPEDLAVAAVLQKG